VPDAIRLLRRLAEHDVDFCEQPVRDHPVGQLAEVRARVPVAVCANEGLWSEADAYARIVARQADVYCFSPYWVGSLAAFQRLAHVAHLEGLQVCKHTHGELGLAAAAAQHLLLTLPNVVDGNQQTAHVMAGDVLAAPLPIASGPRWGVPDGPGLGVDVDPDALRDAARRYEREGQYLPYQREQLGHGG
jgi:L-alanine-DL-glutamate epimerase-like enolase superfamily enzyme